jgi:hypothetical protein
MRQSRIHLIPVNRLQYGEAGLLILRDAEAAQMLRSILPVKDSMGHAVPVLVGIDRAGSEPGVSTDNCLLSAQAGLREQVNDQLETELLIEMHYEQHLAQRGLQELFEKGEPGLPGS